MSRGNAVNKKHAKKVVKPKKIKHHNKPDKPGTGTAKVETATEGNRLKLAERRKKLLDKNPPPIKKKDDSNRSDKNDGDSSKASVKSKDVDSKRKTKNNEKKDPPTNTSPCGRSPMDTKSPKDDSKKKEDDDDDEDDESSGPRTPPERPDYNEPIDPKNAKNSSGEQKELAESKLIVVAKKGDVLATCGVKISVLQDLHGNFGMGPGVVKEVEKKADGLEANAQIEIKYEKKSVPQKRLTMELEVLRLAPESERPQFVPLIYADGEFTTYKIALCQKLGPTLGEVYEKAGTFSVATTVFVALSTMELLRSLHDMLYVLREVHPHSFYVHSKENKLIIGSVGMAKKFGIRKEVEPEEGEQEPKIKFKVKAFKPRKKVCFIGTLKYCPRSSHEHKEHSRRDDMESWFYMFYEMMSSNALPWKATKENKTILEQKETFVSKVQIGDPLKAKYNTELTNILEYFGVSNFYQMEPDWAYFEQNLNAIQKTAGGKSEWDKAVQACNA